MSIINKYGRSLLLAAAVMIGSVCVSNGDNPPALVGQWVSIESLVIKEGEHYVQVVNDSHNAYVALDPRSDVIRQLRKGERLLVLRRGGSWCEVKIDGRVGYMESRTARVMKNIDRNMELFKDGTGLIGKISITWKVENKRIVFGGPNGKGTAANYNVSGYELTITDDDGESDVYVRKEKLEEYKKKKGLE